MKIRGNTVIALVALTCIVSRLKLVQPAIPPDVTAMIDTSIDPCEDFYQYACGKWIKEATIPPDSSDTDISYSAIYNQSAEVIASLAQEQWPYASDFYRSCMNTAQLDKLGAQPLEKQLDSIVKVMDVGELMNVAGQQRRGGNSFITDVTISNDLFNGSLNVVYLGAANLVLPDPSYYYDNETFSQVEPAYRTYVSTLMNMAGFAPGGKYQQYAKRPTQQQGKPTPLDLKTIVDKIIGVEKSIAPSIPTMSGGDWLRFYKPLSVSDAKRKYPLSVGSYMSGLGFLNSPALKPTTNLVFYYLDYFDTVEVLLKNTELLDLKLFLAYSYIQSNVQFLSSSFRTADAELFDKFLNGQQEATSRKDVCMTLEITYLPDAIGNYYYSKKFDQEREDFAQLMVKLIEAAMAEHIAKAKWLDEPTRAVAQAKLKKVTNLIGHSTEPVSFPFQLKENAHFNNVRLLKSFSTDYMIKNAQQPVNRQHWLMSAAEVNAYYDLSLNGMVFPAAILQPPFFNGTYHPAQNFGGIAAVVGHELTHGFDRSGRRFDANGNYRNWWSNATADEYAKRAQCMADEYDAIVLYGESGKPLGNVNGTKTLGENIADNGGLSLAWDAYQQYMKTATNINTRGVLPSEQDKLFFLAYGQSWCVKRTDSAAARRLLVDNHSPRMARVNGVVMNSDPFASTFQCKAASKMNPVKKCQLW